MFVPPPRPGGQFRRTNNRAGQDDAAARPISPPSSVSSWRDRSIPAAQKPRRLCPTGMVAQSNRHHWFADRQDGKVQPVKYHRPRFRNGAWFERFEFVGVFSGRATMSPGKFTEAALPTWRLAQFVFCFRYSLPVHGHFRRKNNPGGSAKLALVQAFRSRRVLTSCVVIPAGEITMGTPQSWGLLFLDLRASACPACSVTSAGEQRNGAAIDAALRSISLPGLRSSARDIDAGGEITKASTPGEQRRSIIAPPLVCVAPGRKLPPST